MSQVWRDRGERRDPETQPREKRQAEKQPDRMRSGGWEAPASPSGSLQQHTPRSIWSPPPRRNCAAAAAPKGGSHGRT
jgi:hypothetical protein